MSRGSNTKSGFAKEARELVKLVSVPSSGSRKDIGSRYLPRGKVYTPNPK
jgi:hypothetical protein